MELVNPANAELAFKVTYYHDESCNELKAAVVGAMSVRDAATIAENIAYSEFHVVSVEEIGPLHLRANDLEKQSA